VWREEGGADEKLEAVTGAQCGEEGEPGREEGGRAFEAALAVSPGAA